MKSQISSALVNSKWKTEVILKTHIFLYRKTFLWSLVLLFIHFIFIIHWASADFSLYFVQDLMIIDQK